MGVLSDEVKVQIVKEILSNDEIECLLRIYRWTKAERYPVFLKYIVKRIHNHSKALNKLKQKGFIHVIKSRDPWRITEDGMRVGGLLAELKIKDLL